MDVLAQSGASNIRVAAPFELDQARLALATAMPTPLPSPTKSSAPLSPPGAVSGLVIDARTGQPIPNAWVTVGRQTLSTDETGRFVFADVPPGTYFVQVQAPAYRIDALPLIAVAPGEARQVDVSLTFAGAGGSTGGEPMTPTAQPIAPAPQQSPAAVPTSVPAISSEPTSTPESETDFPDWRGRYYNNTGLEGDPELERNDEEIDFDWGNDSPGPGIDSQDFSVRWTREQSFDKSGLYRFYATIDGGARVRVDGQTVIDAWQDGKDAQCTATGM